MSKIFGIGCHRTGTTTLGYCLKLLGFGPHADWSNSSLLVKDWARGDYQPILKFAENFGCFDDAPWNYTDVYQHLDIAFPNSKFILTLRDSDNWFRSWKRWHRGDIRSRLKSTTIVPYHRKAFDLKEGFSFDDLGDQYKKIYQERNHEIQEYFSNRTDLLIVDWEKGDGWPQLCEFLNKKIPDRSFPWLNKN